MSKTFCDPPEGWRYGFPKEMPEELVFEDFETPEQYQDAFEKWLLNCGYPESMLGLANNYSRYWEEE